MILLLDYLLPVQHLPLPYRQKIQEEANYYSLLCYLSLLIALVEPQRSNFGDCISLTNQPPIKAIDATKFL